MTTSRYQRRWNQRRWIILAFVLGVAALTIGVWYYGYRQALDQLTRRAQSDLALASDRLSTQLQGYQELAVLTADHPQLSGLQDDERQQAAQTLLLEIADKTAALDVMFVDTTGVVRSAAHGVLGRDVSDTAYFQRAMHGALGSDHGLVGELDLRAFIYAAPAFDAQGLVRGVLIIVADIEDVEWNWRGSNPAVFFTDMSGQVFISNRSELLFWQRIPDAPGLIPANGVPLPFGVQLIGSHEIWQLGWGPYLPRRALHLVQDLPVVGLLGEVLVSVAPARRLAALQASAVLAICLAFGALLYLATERRRSLALANVKLESRVKKRTRALLASNKQLRLEVAERQEAEAALKQAQVDLVQAGKLSALGQMSAGISHELNQPLMAIQSFAENGAQYIKRGHYEIAGDNLGRISDLARRMGRIIKNLRAFARQESQAAGRVDIVAVLESVIELTGPRLRRDGVQLDYNKPATPVWVHGGEVRLGQVFVNLLSNAADAMVASERKVLSIDVSDGAQLTVSVRDTGPGIDMPDKMFEPFYTTKEVGTSEGMGLGLSISYGIVQSFGGDIRGENSPGGGALFIVQLERWRDEVAA
ncbi:MAG: sensor histidine kinase [Rhodobacteraceae bacterium]|nr:sensor histidine kinase [Paracoccaceae bacterium]